MSGICGIVNFDGAPVDPELLKKMAEAAAYRGPDGINYWIEGNVGLATSRPNRCGNRPLREQRKDAILAIDARSFKARLLLPSTVRVHKIAQS